MCCVVGLSYAHLEVKFAIEVAYRSLVVDGDRGSWGCDAGGVMGLFATSSVGGMDGSYDLVDWWKGSSFSGKPSAESIQSKAVSTQRSMLPSSTGPGMTPHHNAVWEASVQYAVRRW